MAGLDMKEEIEKQIKRVKEGQNNIALTSSMIASYRDQGEVQADLIAEAIHAGYVRALRQYAGSYVKAAFRDAQ